MATRGVHPLVGKLASELKPPAVGKTVKAGSAEALAYASMPDRVLFAGFLGGVIEQPPGKAWQVLYLDVAANDCVLVEDEGIVAEDEVKDETVPVKQTRDLIWVKPDASVGRGSTSQSVEALFLSGGFTQARDFEAPPQTGGIVDGAVTGVFCEARTPSCCRIRSRR